MNGHGSERTAGNANGLSQDQQQFGEAERDREQQEEYAFLQRRPASRASDSASIHFLVDDRLAKPRGGHELLAQDVGQIRLSETRPPEKQRQRLPTFTGPRHSLGPGSGVPMAANGNDQVDYSHSDFRRAKAVIEDAAARQEQSGPPERLRRVRQIGDTTVITEHRDPYSFYWQLDKLRKAEQKAPRRPPTADYVLEEEEEEEVREEEEEYFEEDIDEEPAPKQPQFLSPDSGVHVAPEREEGVYAKPVKVVATEDPSVFSHYWHVDSGPPPEEPPPRSRPPQPVPPAVIPSPPLPTPAEPIVREPVIEEHAFRQTTTKRRIELAEEELEEGGDGKPVQFKAHALGQLELKESQLEGAERSQTALNKAMAQLASNAGRPVLLELDGLELRVLNAASGEMLHRVPVQQIRCWAVGRENPREFAFVAREPVSPDSSTICHVFRCEGPAKDVAEALAHACNRLLRQCRPDSLPGSLGRRRKIRQSIPVSPIEEPKRIVRCFFIGVTQVPRATGIEMLNEAVDRLLSEVGRERWSLVDVHISPSAIAIFEARAPQRQIASCRVRYLSFLGVGRDVKHCAFIVAQSADHFVCYVFHAEPSAAPLAKTIEAACKLRYQKVLDAHLGHTNGMPMKVPSHGFSERR